jgi:DNA-binding FrmR family transcriptional regulator
MDSSTQEKAVNRLKSASGHLQGIVAMLEEDRYCIDVIMQIQAVQAALTKTSQMILDSHLHHCVITAIQGDEPEERERVLEEIMQVFKSSSSK